MDIWTLPYFQRIYYLSLQYIVVLYIDLKSVNTKNWGHCVMTSPFTSQKWRSLYVVNCMKVQISQHLAMLCVSKRILELSGHRFWYISHWKLKYLLWAAMCKNSVFVRCFLSHFKQQSPCWKARSHSGSQEIPHPLWNLKDHYHSQAHPLLRQTDAVHTFPPCLSENVLTGNHLNSVTLDNGTRVLKLPVLLEIRQMCSLLGSHAHYTKFKMNTIVHMSELCVF